MNDIEKQEYLDYILSRKSSNKRNYHKECIKELERFKKKHPNQKPKILLHVCCIVCACWPIEFLLSQDVEVTIMFNNSNIWPSTEYDLRLSEVKRYIHERYHDAIKIIECPYDYDTYEATVLKNRKDDPEGWKSCFGCYGKRMQESFAYANEHGYDYFTSVLTFSRQKDSQKINEIGLNLQKQFQNTTYLVSDFKKDSGALKSEKICDEYCIYRQDYCGCRYSYEERHPNTQKSDTNS